MDPISTVQSLCSLAITIITWIDQIRDKKETLFQISQTVTTIHSILSSFQENTANFDLEPSLVNAFVGLADILIRTKEHIAVIRERRRRSSVDTILNLLDPSRVSQQLQKDQEQLSHQLTVIIFSFSSSAFIQDRIRSLPDPKERNPSFRVIRNRDVSEFWRDYLGEKILYARGERFLEALEFRFGNWLSDAARRRFFLRLDEFRIGGVAPSTLERFVGDGTLKQAVERFQSSGSTPSGSARINSLKLPLLVWVDDRPENNTEEVAFAKSKGVYVQQFTCTALAKVWIEENEDFLREHDSADNVRFISDTARFEICDQLGAQNADSYLNVTAGENIARYLRGNLYKAPVLIYCGAGIRHTWYVKSYEATGSTCSSSVACAYITALSNRIDNDNSWQDFDVQ